MTASTTHLVIIPTYNTGSRLDAVVASVRERWAPVLVVVDGSTDGSERALDERSRTDPGLWVLKRPDNAGKGAAVLAGAAVAQARGFTHALVMDADGQHPEESIDEFMTVSQRRPEALVLGRPVFPANVPRERLHGRKLSTGLVRLELLGRGIDDALFGFRVYPLAPLLAEMGARKGGRRYDFDTEAAVRLVWAGVPPCNLSAPVRYFSVAEGGVSHYHYVRDNLTLAGMHVRLLGELLFRRWPGLLGHRRRWRAGGLLGPAVGLLLLAAAISPAVAAEREPDGTRFSDEAWAQLVEDFAARPAVTADFTERRFFPVRREPLVLTGEVRVSSRDGLSLHYLVPDERTVILDDVGMLIRTAGGDTVPPADPRAAPVNEALLNILRLDLAALERNFALEGTRDQESWTLVLVPRTAGLRRGIARITVTGAAAEVQRIELRRSERQWIEIVMANPRMSEAFPPDERDRFFR